MAISFTDLGTPEVSDAVDRATYPTASWTPPNALIIVFVVSVHTASPPPNQPTMSGNNITWTAIATQLSASNTTRITMFAANGSGATAEATQIDFGGQTQRDCTASFLQVDGSDVSNGVAQTIVQTVGGTADNTQNTLSLTLAAAGNSANRPVACFVNIGAASGITPRASWTEYFDSLPDSHEAEAQYRSDAFETTASASDGLGPWIGLAAEIKILTVAANSSRLALLGIG